jgi:hypothetical protein
VLKAQIAYGVVVVGDPKSKLIGIVTTQGNSVIPVENFAAVVPKNDAILWIRKDFLLLYNEFQLSAFDGNWVLHDLKGKPLTTTLFRKLFPFYNGIGIGIYKDKMGLITLILFPNQEIVKAIKHRIII